ncbi:hypothetical protein JCM14469_43130 [Desulfatiferula olefinivorans]
MDYTILPFNAKVHKETVIKLWKNNLRRFFSGRFEWIHDKNPNGEPQTSVAEFCNSEIVGYCSNFPRLLNANGKDYKVGTSIDFIVREDHRVFGPALKMQRETIKKSLAAGYDINIGLPNEPSRGVFKRIGFKPLGKMKNFSKILESEGKFIQYTKSKFLAYLLGFLVDRWFLFSDLFKLFLIKNYKYLFKTLDTCNSDFDEFCNNAKESVYLMFKKDSSYLNWRYADCKSFDYKFYCIYKKKNKKLLGFIVYYIEKNNSTIVDMSFIKPGVIVQALLLSYSMSMRKIGTKSIILSYLGSDVLIDILKKSNFIKRNSSRICYIMLNSEFNEQKSEMLKSEKNWLLFDGEVDL